MGHLIDQRGVLYPAQLPTFHRESAPAELRELIRWFWIPRWNLPPGAVSRQEVLPFPTANLVVEPGGVSLSGPTTGISHRELRGHGWAVGALLRPAALALVHPQPHILNDRELQLSLPALHAAVVEAMGEDDEERGRGRAVDAYSRWAAANLAPPDEDGRLANLLEEVVSANPEITRVDQLAQKLHLSVRSLQRLTKRYMGLPPLAIIRRYRLQEAAHRLRTDPSLSIAQVALDLGYADQAHLANDFRRVLGLPPHRYRYHPKHST
ncbi:AraC family transcriptional regulator [Buchananella hordeovulneris]|uniref:DNA-binding protein n=1 Tax=Buchananella hordeovulneris TaxID=52770 RepID=A0A1Q5PXQ3_9ACTO|nr:helix-turn-helix domain-containing protein [Buchananella hordeovulneris]OKL52398.1 DNA-binding protein [Buchananella hordeovulneris]